MGLWYSLYVFRTIKRPKRLKNLFQSKEVYCSCLILPAIELRRWNMFYILICDEMSKVKSIKLKVKVEIKGENVRLISSGRTPTGRSVPLTASWSGMPNRTKVGGPLWPALHKGWGPVAHASRGSPVRHHPTNIPYRSWVSAVLTGSTTDATAHCHHRRRPPWPAVRARRPQQGRHADHPSLLSVSLSRIRFTPKGKP